MSFFRRKDRPGVTRGPDSADAQQLKAFATDRRGVEGFIEPATQDTVTTLVLVAHDGEWLRRRVDSPKAAFAFGRSAAIPVYEVAAVGYPQRMRDWNARNRRGNDQPAT
jgi:hypothetical protein